MQIPGGWLADRYGGRWFCGGSILLSSMVSLLTPIAARTHIGILVFLRILAGLGQGALFPSVQWLLGHWAQPRYISTIVSITISGADGGGVVGLLLSGFLCDYGFAGGWPSVFYVFGMIGCIWSVVWFLLCYNSPFTHPFISKAERQFWEAEIGAAHPVESDVDRSPTPCGKIITSVPLWALLVACFAESWGFLTIQTCIPLFVHDVLGYNMSHNGIVSALPFLILLPLNPLCGYLSDWLRSPGRLSTNFVRKAFVVIGFALTGVSISLVTYTGCMRILAVLLLCTAAAGTAVSFPTIVVTVHDMAPLHTGKLVGIMYTGTCLAAIGSTMVVGEVTEQNSTREQWRIVFFIAAALYVVGALVFVVFGTAERQSWGEANADDREIITPQTADNKLSANGADSVDNM